MEYFFGVICAILAGVAGFFGQVLQKKAINNVLAQKSIVSMKDLLKNKLWLTGMGVVIIFTTTFTIIAQIFIGPALFPGLFATGFIVLAIGSVKILGEKLKKEEYFAIALLILGVVFLSLSRLSIVGDLARFENKSFIIRLIAFSFILFSLWMGFYYGGKIRKKGILMAIGAGFPFIIGNLSVQPLILCVESFFSQGLQTQTLIIFFIAGPIALCSNLSGTVHFQKALAQGNASIIVPAQQIPQQLAPVIIYFLVYSLSAPSFKSYIFMPLGIVLIIFAGFLLSKRQTQIVKTIDDAPKNKTE